LALLLGGCVPMWTGDDMQEDIDSIRAEQRAMQENYQEEKTRLTEMIASAREDVDALKGVLKEARALLQRNNADLGVEIQNTREEMTELRGELERLDFKMRRLEQDLEIFKEDVDLRFDGRGMGAELPEEATPLYEHAEAELEAQRYRQARRALETFLKDFSSHARAADARFYLGETHREEGQFVSAIAEYRKVLEAHEESPRAGDATYRIGEALMELGRCDQAKTWFEVLVEDHGSSQFVADAHQKLNLIKSGKCP
jgi:tol-pal system protein YbgF